MDVTIQDLIRWMSHCEISASTLMNVTMQHQLSLMSQCYKNIVIYRIVTYTLMYATIWYQHSWMSHCHINFDDVAMWHQLCWMSQCDINLDKCHNLTKTLFFVALWHILWCLLHTYITIHGLLSCDVMFEVSCNVTYPSFYVTIDATWSLMIVTM